MNTLFKTGLLIGCFSNIIFFLGLNNLLYKWIIVVISILFFVFILLLFKKNRLKIKIKNNLLFNSSLFLFILISIINLLGVFVPETAFDALWYHLTLPKLFILYNEIFFIQGGLLYYSAMPKLIDLLFIPSLIIGNEHTAKFVQFIFGILISIGIYIYSQKFFGRKIALLAALVFYSNLVVAWESTTAYIDLGRTFFEYLAFVSFSYWVEKTNVKYFLLSAILLGFAISSKLLAIGSLGIILLLLFIIGVKKKYSSLKIIFFLSIYVLFTLIIVFPWLLFSYINTGNIFYPFFSSIYPVTQTVELLNLITFIKEVWVVLTKASDPVSPIYIIVIPLLILFFKKFTFIQKIWVLYAFLSLILWYITPNTGGGRFILAYLPIYSLLVGLVLYTVKSNFLIYKFLVGCILFISFLTIGYRGLALAQDIPYLMGKETKSEYLKNNLNFAFGDYYDTDGYMDNTITSKDKALLIGFHNLYYINFPFIDYSWLKKGDRFNYIATQHTQLPEKFAQFVKIYENRNTGVILYSLPNRIWYRYE